MKRLSGIPALVVAAHVLGCSGGSDSSANGAGAANASGGSAQGGSNASGGSIAGGSGGSTTSAGGATVASGGTQGAGGSSGSGGAATSTGGAVATNGTARLFYLDVVGSRVVTAGADGSDAKTLVPGATGTPDGIAVDVGGGHVFWTTMGDPNADDGTVSRADLSGTGLTAVVPAGGTFTPKQLKLDSQNHKLYWSDREGMRVMRANLDGSNVETLVQTGQGDVDRQNAANWCVGIAVDVAGKKIYWTQKGGDNANVGSIRRAAIEIPSGETAANRSDVEVLFTGLPEPIDLDLDLTAHTLYWTDRGNPPRGNTVNRAPMDPPAGFDPATRADQEILVSNLHEGIGIALDRAGGRMFFTDLGGTVYTANLDGTGQRSLLTSQGILTGIAYAVVPP